MLRAKRKRHITEFSFANNYPSAILLALVFLSGLYIVWAESFPAAVAYIGLWGVSYLVIFAGTCRYCVYYGKKCPIPFEGSCVNKFFPKARSPFGYPQLFWATAAYGFRVILPVIFIFAYKETACGIIYFSLLILFWIIHLRVSGCPNCMNTRCPLNPEH